jgi:hypothetical protein
MNSIQQQSIEIRDQPIAEETLSNTNYLKSLLSIIEELSTLASYVLSNDIIDTNHTNEQTKRILEQWEKLR